MEKRNKIKDYFRTFEATFKQQLFMGKRNAIYSIYRFYADGFRNMTVGKTLWAVIIIKLIIIFFVIKLFFFHDYIGENAGKGNEAAFVSEELMRRQ